MEIKRHLQSCLKSHEGTKTILLKGINKDAKKDHRYVLFFYTDEDKKVTCIHIGQWLFITFPQAFIQSSITYQVKVNNMRADAIIDLTTNKARDGVCQELSSSSGYSISRVGWLSAPGKQYGPIVVHFVQKEHADKVLAQGLLEIGGESACTGIWIEKSNERRCFNCQQYRHIVPLCKNEKTCGNCATLGHTHQECLNPQQK